MARWGPDARGRLAEAALTLYQQRGFSETSVAEIAERAGLTERTFFRHFADKREVLFGVADRFQDLIVGAVTAAPDSATPIEAVVAGLEAAGQVISDRQYSRRRQAIIAANPELRERDLTKMSSLAAGVADALRGRGVADPSAALAAETGVGAFKVAFQRWLDATDERTLSDHVRESIVQLKGLLL